MTATEAIRGLIEAYKDQPIDELSIDIFKNKNTDDPIVLVSVKSSGKYKCSRATYLRTLDLVKSDFDCIGEDIRLCIEEVTQLQARKEGL